MNIQTSIQIELIKLKRRDNFILLGLLVLVLALIVFTTFKGTDSGENHISFAFYFNTFILKELWIVNLFISLFIIRNVGKEFSEKTLRKIIIDGVSRDELFRGKLSLLFLSCLFVFVLVISFLLIGGAYANKFSELTALLTPEFLIKYFFKLLFAGIFGFFLVWLVQSISTAFIIYIIWGTIIEHLIAQLINRLAGVEIDVIQYMPVSSIEKVLSVQAQGHIYDFILPVFYAFMMLFISYYLLIKRDIK